MTIAYDFFFECKYAAPLAAFKQGRIKAVLLKTTTGQKCLVVHGTPCEERMLQIIGEHRKMFIEADIILSCHNEYYPEWVRKKVPLGLRSKTPLSYYIGEASLTTWVT